MPLRPPAGYIRPGYDPLKVPDAPTIGTATDAKDGKISVTFTAPTNPGGGAITTYYVVAGDSSSGAQFTASGSSSPIVVTGLTNGNTYTARVYAVNSFGPSAYSAASGSVVPSALAIVDAFGGGYYTGKIVQGGTTYYLIVAPKSSGENSSKLWKTANTAGPTAARTLNNGPAASSSMNSSTYPAAQFCEGLSIGGYTDWYLPARDELELCYRNLKPTTAANNTNAREKSSYTYPEGNDVSGDTMGINRNSSPTGSAYTSSVPAQTSVTAFQTGNTEAFAADMYWSSSDYSSTSAWEQFFVNGTQVYYTKSGYSFYVRAVRRVAV